MKHSFFKIYLIFIFAASSCTSKSLPFTSTPIEDLTLPTHVNLNTTSSPSNTQTATVFPVNTLESDLGKKQFMAFLQGSSECETPCFLGIMPDKTTINEAQNIVSHLNLILENTNRVNETKYYYLYIVLDDDMSTGVTLAVENDIVKNINIGITPNRQSKLNHANWSAYSPDTLISRYGTPSSVTFEAFGSTYPSYEMVMYFNKVNLIVYYSSRDISPEWQICPLADQMEFVNVWIGKNPDYPPPSFPASLEKATSMTMEEFAKAMTGDPNNACFELKPDMFP